MGTLTPTLGGELRPTLRQEGRVVGPCWKHLKPKGPEKTDLDGHARAVEGEGPERLLALHPLEPHRELRLVHAQ